MIQVFVHLTSLKIFCHLRHLQNKSMIWHQRLNCLFFSKMQKSCIWVINFFQNFIHNWKRMTWLSDLRNKWWFGWFHVEITTPEYCSKFIIFIIQWIMAVMCGGKGLNKKLIKQNLNKKEIKWWSSQRQPNYNQL